MLCCRTRPGRGGIERWFLVLSLTLMPLTLLSSCGEQGSQAIINVLSGVAAVSPTDIWAVGHMSSQTVGSQQVLTEHWDGKQWRVVPALVNGALADVAAVATNDVWAVGTVSRASPLMMHWNGTRWSQVSTPDGSGSWDTELFAVAAVSSHDVWTVGLRNGSLLILHWDGQQWQTVAPASPPDFRHGSLDAVRVISSTDVWAVGGYSKRGGGPSLPLTEHWNGRHWQLVPTPPVVTGTSQTIYGEFYGLTAISSKDVWAVGLMDDFGSGGTHTLAEHWTGSQWEVMNPPTLLGRSASYAQTIFAANAHALWLTGYGPAQKSYSAYPWLLHWDGQHWLEATPPSLRDTSGMFLAGTAVGANDLWVIGYTNGTFSPSPFAQYSMSSTLIEHWNGASWSQVSSPNSGQLISIPEG